jgi:hypothetical protein
MKTLITVVTLALLVACTPANDKGIRDVSHRYSEVCLNGVVYYTGQYRLTPKFKPDSTVETCE